MITPSFNEVARSQCLYPIIRKQSNKGKALEQQSVPQKSQCQQFDINTYIHTRFTHWWHCQMDLRLIWCGNWRIQEQQQIWHQATFLFHSTDHQLGTESPSHQPKEIAGQIDEGLKEDNDNGNLLIPTATPPPHSHFLVFAHHWI